MESENKHLIHIFIHSHVKKTQMMIEMKQKNHPIKNKISLISGIAINLNRQYFDSLNSRNDIEYVKIIILPLYFYFICMTFHS